MNDFRSTPEARVNAGKALHGMSYKVKEVKYSVMEDVGGHPSEGCFHFFGFDLSIGEAISLYNKAMLKSPFGNLRIVVSNVDELIGGVR